MLAFADMPRGEKFVQRLWKDIKAGNIKKIGHYTSKHFQGVANNQMFSRCEKLNFLKNLKISDYRFTDIRTTEGEKVITVTYQVFVTSAPQIKQQPVPDLPGFIESRLDVWKKYDGKWKWVADAALLMGVGATPPISEN